MLMLFLKTVMKYICQKTLLFMNVSQPKRKDLGVAALVKDSF